MPGDHAERTSSTTRRYTSVLPLPVTPSSSHWRRSVRGRAGWLETTWVCASVNDGPARATQLVVATPSRGISIDSTQFPAHQLAQGFTPARGPVSASSGAVSATGGCGLQELQRWRGARLPSPARPELRPEAVSCQRSSTGSAGRPERSDKGSAAAMTSPIGWW